MTGFILTAAGILLLTAQMSFSNPFSSFRMNILPDFLVYTGFQDISICSLALILGGVAFLLISLSPPVGCGIKDLF
jgi:membrane-bound ClpP family serine protease